MINLPGIRSLRLPNNELDEKTVERVEKFDGQAIIVKKVLPLADGSEVLVSSYKIPLTTLNTEIESINAQIANYENAEWIAQKISELNAKKADIQAKKELLLT